MNRMRRLLTRRPWITVLIVVIVAGGIAGGVWWFADRNANATAAASGPINRLVAASVGTIKKSITTSGTLTPADQEQVNFAATGTVTAVNVSAGQTVTAGQPLATVDTLQMQATLAADQATLATDQAKLVSDQDASASDTQVAADQAAIAVAQADVNARPDSVELRHVGLADRRDRGLGQPDGGAEGHRLDRLDRLVGGRCLVGNRQFGFRCGPLVPGQAAEVRRRGAADRAAGRPAATRPPARSSSSSAPDPGRPTSPLTTPRWGCWQPAIRPS